MSLRVFHAPGDWAAADRLRLSPEESRYLLRVRRARVGATLEVLDGEARAWRARLAAIEGQDGVVELTEPVPAVSVVPLELVLVVPDPRATLEALTLASELGATAVRMVVGEHSPGGLPKPERVERTLRASQRQCGRPCPPSILWPRSLADALRASAHRPGFVASVPQRHLETPAALDPRLGARLLVGPEGGLAQSEAQVASDAGFRPLSLGPWVLRSPTAVAAGLARLRGAQTGPAAQPGDGPG